MKLVSLFFLFAIILMVNVMASTHRGHIILPATLLTAKDTIIKMDSVRDKKLFRSKKVAATSKKAQSNTAYSKNDTTKKPKEQPLTHATAVDSSYFDQDNKIYYLWGRAHVVYEDFELEADYIRVDQKNHLIFARGSIDPKTKRYVGRPIAKSKSEKPVASDSLLFDYNTKKGKTWNPATEQEGNYISGGQAKRINENEVAYRNVIFSTCDLPMPDTHFGIVITEGIGQKNRIISKLAYLEIEGVPLPLGLPFGFFPKPNSRTSGFILPTFGEDAQLGFYLRNFGYYVALNENIDVTTMGTLYSRGSYELNSSARYLKRYKYGGNFMLSYGSHNYGLPGDPPRKDFNVTWTHSQDPNANPGTTFSASVNAGTSSFNQNQRGQNNYNLGTLTQNNLRSSISYSRVWEGTPFNLNVSLGHSQDLTKKTVTLELPTFSFNMSTLSPFDSKTRVGEQKWYQKITVGYSLVGTNKLTDVPEAELFTGNTFSKRLQNGFQHTIPIGFNTNLKYFQFNTSATYIERWYTQSIDKRFERGSIAGQVVPITDTVGGFVRSGEYSLNAGLSTKFYGQANFKKGNLKAIRHITTPSISFSYKPDYGLPSYGYYKTAVSPASVPYPYTAQRYSIFEQSVYGGPSIGKQAGIGFSLDNTIEAKMKARSTDTSGTDRKIPILQGLSFSTFYNFAQDSLRLSPISFSGHTAIFNQKVNINFGGILDPYVNQVRDSISNGAVLNYVNRINRYTFQDGKFPMLSSFNLSMSGSVNSTTFKPKQRQQQYGTDLQHMTPEQTQKLALINGDPSQYIDFNIPWNVSINYSFNYQNNVINSNSSNTIMVSGDVSLTQKWKIQYNTTYDLKARQLSSATSFAIYRDLHCWDLSIQWLPFGYYKSYNVTIKVKASILQDLKLSKRSDYTNTQSFN